MGEGKERENLDFQMGGKKGEGKMGDGWLVGPSSNVNELRMSPFSSFRLFVSFTEIWETKARLFFF